jgi:Fungal chitosanase of glycosyl hydrolase group 75
MNFHPDERSPFTDTNAVQPRTGRTRPLTAGRRWFGLALRLLVLLIVALLLVIPFTPVAGRIKAALKELVTAASGKQEVITREVEKRVEVPVTKEVIKEVIKEVPAPPAPLPDSFVPKKEVDVATLFNGIQIQTKLETAEGNYASLERTNPEAYRASFQVSIRVPKANQTLPELTRVNPALPQLLPDLPQLLEKGRVSGFYHQLYENKTRGIQRDLTRLTKALDRHNFFDCETILELSHPTSQRRALLIQSEMDVVADGSDGDRMATLDEYIYLSDYYQPFTSYAWDKQTEQPNPLLAKWQERYNKVKEQSQAKGLTNDKKRELKAAQYELDRQIQEMKNHSWLIAEKDPFIVISLLFKNYAARNPFTPQIGDYAVVIYGDKMYPAICGDYGPSMKMGEASLRIAKTLNPKATPYRRPESDLKVTYLIFPGTAERPNRAPNLDHWHAQCQRYLQEVGGAGAGTALHRWEDPFKKPELAPALPPPVPVQPEAGR